MKYFSYILMICLLLIFACIPLHAQSDVIPTGSELLKRLNKAQDIEASRGRSRQIIQTTSGKERVFELESFSGDSGSSSLTRYLKPASVKGQAFLTLNDANDIWTYFPRTRRVRKLASHARKNRVQGSDFTYEDMGSGDEWLNQYDAENLGEISYEKHDCWQLELIKRPESDATYSKLLVLMRKIDDFPLKINYHDEDGKHFKTLFMEDIRDIEGHATPMRVVMKNLEEGSQTQMEIIEVTYKWIPPDGFFTELNLKR
jgi:Outer membrane lipoprotein-sorting protein